MLLEGIFGGGGQSTSPSQQPSSGQTSGGTPANDEATPSSPADNSQANPIYDEEPGETDDGTYTDVPPASSEDTAPVTEEPSAATPDTEEAGSDAGVPVNDGAGEAVDGQAPAEAEAEAGANPQPADQPDAPAAWAPSEEASEAAGPAPSAGTPSQSEPSQPQADEPVASQPVAGQPAASAPGETAAEDTASAPGQASAAPAPVATNPSPVATAPVDNEEVAPAAEQAEELKDFLTPLLANLEEIRQRQASGTSDARAESRNRAIAAIQDQLASRLLDSLSSETTTATAKSTSLIDDNAKAAEKPISLVNRWYAEA